MGERDRMRTSDTHGESGRIEAEGGGEESEMYEKTSERKRENWYPKNKENESEKERTRAREKKR